FAALRRIKLTSAASIPGRRMGTFPRSLAYVLPHREAGDAARYVHRHCVPLKIFRIHCKYTLRSMYFCFYSLGNKPTPSFNSVP
uniref:Uncharacterized protein n=1 Tax=Salarias fasciatus TaxID=181472 RepID=A0A672JLY4_SALFA